MAKRAREPYKCYTCGRKIRFLPADNIDGFIKCDFHPDYVNRKEFGELFYDALGRPFRGEKNVVGEWTVIPGYKIHKCFAS